MPLREFVIGIDGGGTKTVAVLADLDGTVLAQEMGGPSNFQIVGVEEAAETLFSVIELCCAKAGAPRERIAAIVAGLAGAGRDADRERIREGLLSLADRKNVAFQRVVIESDARIALEGAFKGGIGIILIAGTGSIAFAKDAHGTVHRAGGWGRILGDEGSGYTIGREGLNAVTKHLDGRGKKTFITDLLATEFGYTTQEHIITAVYKDGFDVASVAPLVIEAASKGDAEAARILNRATFELAEHVRTLVGKIEHASPLRQKIPLSFIGSVIATENVFSSILKHKITFTLPQIKIIQPQAPPSFGAVLLAIQSVRQSS